MMMRCYITGNNSQSYFRLLIPFLLVTSFACKFIFFIFMLPAGITPPGSSFQFLDDAIRNCSSTYIPLNPYTVPNRSRQDANIHNRTSTISKTAR